MRRSKTPKQCGSESADCEPVHPQAGRGRAAAPEEVVPDSFDAGEHRFEVARHVDLGYRVRDAAVFDPEALGAAREVAGRHVHAKTHEVGEKQPLPDVAIKVLWRSSSGGKHE